jgi:hypothetical protein
MTHPSLVTLHRGQPLTHPAHRFAEGNASIPAFLKNQFLLYIGHAHSTTLRRLTQH